MFEMRSMNVLSLVCFLAITLLLAWQITLNKSDHARVLAASRWEYQTEIVDQGPKNSEPAVKKLIEDRTSTGWDVVTATVYYPDYQQHVGPVYLVVFRKPSTQG